jgi:hypothetical protein
LPCFPLHPAGSQTWIYCSWGGRDATATCNMPVKFAGLPDGIFWNQIRVNFVGYCNGRCWSILWPFGPFYGQLMYFMDILYICLSSGIFFHFGILHEDNLATLVVCFPGMKHFLLTQLFKISDFLINFLCMLFNPRKSMDEVKVLAQRCRRRRFLLV